MVCGESDQTYVPRRLFLFELRFYQPNNCHPMRCCLLDSSFCYLRFECLEAFHDIISTAAEPIVQQHIFSVEFVIDQNISLIWVIAFLADFCHCLCRFFNGVVSTGFFCCLLYTSSYSNRRVPLAPMPMSAQGDWSLRQIWYFRDIA